MLFRSSRAIELAHSLGSRVIVAGLSVSGTAVAHLAQVREDLDRAVLLSPFLAPGAVPGWTCAFLTPLLLFLPNVFLWWDPALKEKIAGPEYCYPRFPTRVIGEFMHLGASVLREAKRTAPNCRRIFVVLTHGDRAANNFLTARLAGAWKAHGAAVRCLEFPESAKVPHDFIDPHQPNQKTGLVYPKLVELFEQ